jgi:hypothetical protein
MLAALAGSGRKRGWAVTAARLACRALAPGTGLAREGVARNGGEQARVDAFQTGGGGAIAVAR